MAKYKLDNLYTKEEFMSKRGLTDSELQKKLEDGDIDIVTFNGGALIKDGEIELEQDYLISPAVNKILSLKKANVKWIEDKIKSIIEEVEEKNIVEAVQDRSTIQRIANRLTFLCDLQDALMHSKYNLDYKVYEEQGKQTDYITFIQNKSFE